MATTIPQPVPSTSNAASPPPNCAICLGNCSNKCFTDSCMHQFCFKCLLEWSKVKAVCPLCKQPFSKIMHNVKLDNTYDEHYIERDANNTTDDEHSFLLRFPESSNYDFFLPTSTSRLFQLITSLAVDPRGEFAFQQLLSAQPLTNNQSFYDYMPGGYDNFIRYGRRRTRERDLSSSNFRRSIYSLDLWVTAAPDITGRYRDISPLYYRGNPSAKNRLVPWLNRELNVLLQENTPHVMYVVDTILMQLNHHHIRSQHFKQLLEEFFGARTDHFIHEFYNYMKSPYDMVGYDRHVSYGGQPTQTSIRLSDDDSSSDSDVAIVSVGLSERTAEPVVIEIDSDSSRDSDVIYQEPPPPVIVDLVNSDSSETVEIEHHRPILPLKLRLKHKRQCWRRKAKRKYTDSSSDNESSDSSSNKSSDYSHKKYKRKRKYQKSKYYIVKNDKQDTDSDSDHEQDNTDTESDSKDEESILSRLEKSNKLSKHWKHKYFLKPPVETSRCSSDSSNSDKYEIEANGGTDSTNNSNEGNGTTDSSSNSIKHEIEANETTGTSNKSIKPKIEEIGNNNYTFSSTFHDAVRELSPYLNYEFPGSSRLPIEAIWDDIDAPGPSGIQQMDGSADSCFPPHNRCILHTCSDDSSSID